jgi:hypothetical protein
MCEVARRLKIQDYKLVLLNEIGMLPRVPASACPSLRSVVLTSGSTAALVVGSRTVTLLHAVKSSLCATLRTLCWGVKPHFIMIRMPSSTPSSTPSDWNLTVSTLVLEVYENAHALHVQQDSAGNVYYTDTCGHWCEVPDAIL